MTFPIWSPLPVANNLLIVGTNAPGHIPLWQHRLGLLEHVETNGGLFVASVMPQLMSDLEKTWNFLEEALGRVTNAIYLYISDF